MNFEDRILQVQSGPLRAAGVDILQVNLGYRCNMSCSHCHISAGPHRTEEMSLAIVETVLAVLRSNKIPSVDITGGAPELNPHFRFLVAEACRTGSRVRVRTNLTVFFEEGMERLFDFYRDREVDIVASLPCYMADNVDRIRGTDAFRKSVTALRRLNTLGYGKGRPGRELNLVYNPSGPFPAPPQKILEADYRSRLTTGFGISFDNLYTFANMPVGRFRDRLLADNGLDPYMQALENAFNPETVCGLMCRHMISVGWDGTLFDCDFNQALGLRLHAGLSRISDFDPARLSKREITVGEHCYGCTAGQGST